MNPKSPQFIPCFIPKMNKLTEYKFIEETNANVKDFTDEEYSKLINKFEKVNKYML